MGFARYRSKAKLLVGGFHLSERPGSFVYVGATLEAAASRVPEEATGLKVEVMHTS